MGLFRRKKKEKKSDEYVVPEERIQEILANGVELQLGVGVHGNDEVVAGAMMGSTAKLIAMNNYGKVKYVPTVLHFYDDYMLFQVNGQKIPMGTIYQWEKRHVGLAHTEFAFLSHSVGEILLKATHSNFLATIEVLKRVSQEYVDRVNREQAEAEKLEEQNKAESDMDRLIRLGELHERGLLSDEEFEEAKKKLL